MIDRFEKFLFNITEIDLYIHRITSAEMKAFGLKGNYVMYFTKLKDHPEGVTAAKLGAMCGKDKADISRDINALEKAGLVSRVSTGTTQGRSYRTPIVLTEKGKEVTDQIIEKINEVVGKIGEGLTEEDREIFYRCFDQIAANMEKISQQG